MTKKKIYAKITNMVSLASDIISIWIKAEDAAIEAKPGQFISMYCEDGSRLLPRPISICEVDKDHGLLRLVYRIIGEGTREFARLKEGDDIAILGPFGNGFPLVAKKAMIIGGGIGIPPMLELAKNLSTENTIVLGYRDELFLNHEFEEFGQVYIATEDGSAGSKGNVLDAIRLNALDAEVIYACGPLPMLKGIKAYAADHNIEAWLSMEEKMACGVGACLACVCQSKEEDHHTKVKNKRICKDGPVFLATEVEFE